MLKQKKRHRKQVKKERKGKENKHEKQSIEAENDTAKARMF